MLNGEHIPQPARHRERPWSFNAGAVGWGDQERPSGVQKAGREAGRASSPGVRLGEVMAPAAILVLYQQEPKLQAFIKWQLCTAKPLGDRQTVAHQSWPVLAL